MRLIDADELDIYDVSPAYGMCVMGVTQEDIDDAPTVEAIPIEWMREWGKTRGDLIGWMLHEWAERKEGWHGE